jgi:hypothetical protein
MIVVVGGGEVGNSNAGGGSPIKPEAGGGGGGRASRKGVDLLFRERVNLIVIGTSFLRYSLNSFRELKITLPHAWILPQARQMRSCSSFETEVSHCKISPRVVVGTCTA